MLPVQDKLQGGTELHKDRREFFGVFVERTTSSTQDTRKWPPFL